MPASSWSFSRSNSSFRLISASCSIVNSSSSPTSRQHKLYSICPSLLLSPGFLASSSSTTAFSLRKCMRSAVLMRKSRSISYLDSRNPWIIMPAVMSTMEVASARSTMEPSSVTRKVAMEGRPTWLVELKIISTPHMSRAVTLAPFCVPSLKPIVFRMFLSSTFVHAPWLPCTTVTVRMFFMKKGFMLKKFSYLRLRISLIPVIL
mmetsp:Transcript_26849/g.58524  ORF Transcript_26849/g.58524 Transcript_26849/m.58524 type:complete len:205 (-) Transcript_26849:1203-1817(-)